MESSTLPAGFPGLAMDELASLLLATPSVDDVLDLLVGMAARIVVPPVSAGISLRRDGAASASAASDDLAAHIQQLESYGDDGPSLETLRTGRAVLVEDMAREHRWTQYTADVLALGVRASLSLPLTLDDDAVGVLSLYGPAPLTFDSDTTARAAAFAEQAGAACRLAIRQADQQRLTRQLQAALASRAVIDQAMGILMAQQRCTPEEAFTMLRNASQTRNRKVRDVAAEIVTSVAGRSPKPPPFRRPY